MKNKSSIFLVVIVLLMLSIIGCSGGKKKAFDSASIAYTNIDEAYVLIDAFGSDIYNAWRIGIYDKDEVSVRYLASKLNLHEWDIRLAIDDLTGTDDFGDLYFLIFKDDLFSACVMMVSKAYDLNGTVEEIGDYLDDAKISMKELSEKYSDYEHYPNLKKFYTRTNSFFEFCQNPSGSFEQVKTTINDYRNDIRTYKSDLDFIFD